MINDDLYDALRGLATAYFRGQPLDHTLEPTALVNEAWLKMCGRPDWSSRTHFFAAGAAAMRQVLVDHARSRQAEKRGGRWQRVTLSGRPGADDASPIEVLDLHDALERLERVDPRQARMVELRFFGGLGASDIASICGVSRRTVELDLQMARAWLARSITGEAATGGEP
ncbi:MAG: hypothetical protein KDA28_03570 [Phycisphaerales bacterium]|nr:hypothetical protein [Phycisphaerales bacterium]